MIVALPYLVRNVIYYLAVRNRDLWIEIGFFGGESGGWTPWQKHFRVC